MGRIEVLSDSVARRIAAGEVIERPASVVKELVENSLDAGARGVVVEIDQGGTRRIAVTDDGEGMARDEVAVAFRPHATSKIRSEDDLLCVRTLGFRGEALPSIAAVSETEVWTRRRAEPVGTRFRIRAGEPLAVEDAGTASGCRIEVKDLFFNTPVRRKFLRSPATEAGHVAQLVGRVALAHPTVGFTLVQDGREVLALSPGDLATRVRRVLGREVESEMCGIEEEGPIGIAGLATHPHYSAANPRAVLFYVNQRFVRDRLLLHALMSAYATLLPHGRYPAAVLLLAVPPAEVDVNVHPTKLEVRFRDSQAVHEAIRRAIRRIVGRLEGAGAVAEAGARYAPGRPSALPSTEDRSMAPARALRLVPAAPPEPSPLFPPLGRYGRLRVVGQVFDGYLVCEGDGEVVLIDQHAAHERVAFERLRDQRRRGRVESQILLVPQTVDLEPGDAELLADAAAGLAGYGLEVEIFGERTLRVRAVPAIFPAEDAGPLLRALASDLAEVGDSRAIEERAEDLLATIACHSVVRVGQRLSETEIRALLAAMDAIDLSTNCPHGRPVTATLARGELERRFGR
jgi:DNA mismatch repair protein MutL